MRAQLSLALEGILSQALIPRADGRGLVLALEIMLMTPAIRNLIREQQNPDLLSHADRGEARDADDEPGAGPAGADGSRDA